MKFGGTNILLLMLCIDPMQKWLLLNYYYFFKIQNSLINLTNLTCEIKIQKNVLPGMRLARLG